jgi:hypothetical protein
VSKITHPAKYSDAFSAPSLKAMLIPKSTAARICTNPVYQLHVQKNSKVYRENYGQRKLTTSVTFLMAEPFPVTLDFNTGSVPLLV